MRIAKQLVAFIEVKRITTKLGAKHLRQVETYAANEAVVNRPWFPGGSPESPGRFNPQGERERNWRSPRARRAVGGPPAGSRDELSYRHANLPLVNV